MSRKQQWGRRRKHSVRKELIMARGFNQVLLVGTLTKAVELRYTSGGTAIAELSLAGNDHVTIENEVKELAWYHRVTLFGKSAEWVTEKNPDIGTPVFVEGSINYRAWETPEGIKRNALDVKANRIELLTFGARIGETTVLDSKNQPRLKNALNQVTLIGNLTRDAELRNTPNHHAVTTMGLAINETRGKGDKAEEITHYIDLQLWRDLAESAAELKKGQAMFVQGRLVNDSWTNDDNEKRYVTRLEVSWLEVLAKAPIDAERPSTSKGATKEKTPTMQVEEELPF
jgi:single-strand DNA-binding protein